MVEYLGNDDSGVLRGEREGLAETVYVVDKRALRHQNTRPDSQLCGVVFEQACGDRGLGELWGTADLDQVLREEELVAERAVQRLPELALPALGRGDPGEVLKRRTVPDMLRMAAGEQGEPVAFLVLSEGLYRAVQVSAFNIASRVAGTSVRAAPTVLTARSGSLRPWPVSVTVTVAGSVPK